MKVLVTGANGFVGSHVAERLAARGVELRLLLRPTSRLRFLEGIDYERVDGDVRDPESLAKAVEGVDAVAHLAVLTAAVSERLFQEVNAIGTANLVRAAQHAGVGRFVYVSSLAAQGPNPDRDTLVVEPPRPVSAYGRSKLAGEHPVFAAQHNMSVAVIRPSAVYGQRDRALLPLYRMGKLGAIPVYGDGRNLLSWIHVHDAASAIVAATMAEGPSGATYFVSDGGFYTWLDLVDAFGRAWGRRPRVIKGPGQLFTAAGYAGGVLQTVSRRALTLNPDQIRHMRARYWICDNSAITADLGWCPRVGLDEGFAETLAWYREQRWL
ncbi:MAG TPA: NAD-dependent epimerase/dehydratase family protein [Dehalococcoidia bacterium]|jgi:nucleoside-diphosphate-sugar epimerase|nr:NAD-dependent epimerase/dehydratase family protein [Dehalococcoidia bacterium]